MARVWTVFCICLSLGLADKVKRSPQYFSPLPKEDRSLLPIYSESEPKSNAALGYQVSKTPSKRGPPVYIPKPPKYEPTPKYPLQTRYSPEPKYEEPARYQPEPKYEEPSRYQPEPKYKEPSRYQPEPKYTKPTRYQPEPKYKEPTRYQPEPKYQKPSRYQPEPKYQEPSRYQPKTRYQPEPSYPPPARYEAKPSRYQPKPSDIPPPAYSDGPYEPSGYDEGGKIPGVAGVDYPVYHTAPYTKFDCGTVPYAPGFYADVEAGCQAYHICHDGRYGSQGATFLCTNGTIFNQYEFTCDWWYNVNCDEAPSHYDLNLDPYKNPYIPTPEEEAKKKQAAAYGPKQPDYRPAEPAYRPSKPAYKPAEPDYRPAEPAYRPAEPSYQPRQPAYQPRTRGHSKPRTYG